MALTTDLFVYINDTLCSCFLPHELLFDLEELDPVSAIFVALQRCYSEQKTYATIEARLLPNKH